MNDLEYSTRRIFRSNFTSKQVVRELLQSIFLAELMAPESDFWLVSPWISDVELLDNRRGSFSAINPEWGRRPIRLSEVLVHLLTTGTLVRIVTKPDLHNQTFIDRMRERAQEAGVEDGLTIIQHNELHTKGILTSWGLLTGSMNLTYNGVEINDEHVSYETDIHARSGAKLTFKAYLDLEAK